MSRYNRQGEVQMELTGRSERQYLWGDREGLLSGSRMFICDEMVVFQRDEADPYPHHYEVRISERVYRERFPFLKESGSIWFQNPEYCGPYFRLEMSLCPQDPKMVRIRLQVNPFPLTTPGGSVLPQDLDFNIALESLALPALQSMVA